MSSGVIETIGITWLSLIITARIRRMGEGTVFSLSVHTQEGGVPGRGGGVPGPGRGGGSQVQFRGGTWSQVQGGTQSQVGGGYPVSVKGKFLTPDLAWYMFRPEKNFCGGTPHPVKGKFFDTRLGLIHVQTEEKNFCRGTPPPPQE